VSVPPNETTTPESTPPGEETPGEEQTPETPGADEAPKDGETPPEEKPQMSHEDAVAEVTKTRAEAANYRTRARDAEAKLKTAKTLEEVEAIVATMTSEREQAERALLVENVALKFDLPDNLAARLQGATREELEKDAESLSELIGASTPRLRGGLTPHEEPDDEPSDPGALARKYGRGRRSSR
jgi:hypothetical protein